MALKKREKLLVGAMVVAIAIAAIGYLALPQWDALDANQKKITEIETNIKNLTQSRDTLNIELNQLKAGTALPSGVKIPTFSGNDREVVIKRILGDVAEYATQSGNKFISLKPYEAPPIIPPPPENEEGEQQEGEEAKEDTPPPPPPVVSVGYELAIRGTYATIQQFLTLMDSHKELVELNSIEILNEAGPARVSETPTPEVILDPSKPIKLTAKMRLILQTSN